MRNVVYALLLLLYIVHTDLWFWDDPSLVLGIPIGFAYHVFFMVAASFVLWLGVKFAWPTELETKFEGPEGDASPGDGTTSDHEGDQP